MIFRVRADLDRSQPRIWRRLDLRSDLTLDVVHRVLQTAFGWSDAHLWRFSLGGDPFDPASRKFLASGTSRRVRMRTRPQLEPPR